MLYEKLRGPREIRLLEFLNDDEPSCRIVHAELDKTPYAALSYTWGANIFDHVLKIQGISFKITENLYDALKALNKYVCDSGLMLWVDAVCINQQDIQERNHQVRLMSAVYGSAKTVLVWLGNPYADSNLAMDKMKEWNAESSSIYYGPVGSEPHRAWLSILALWERSWWRRAWI
ncbi:HET-domain-containing protein, partial [Glonium stellatum]